MTTNKRDKWYVVRRGRRPGIYSSWEKCQEQVHRFSGALYESYYSREEAKEAFPQGGTMTYKQVINKHSGHNNGYWGTFLELECGHIEWRKGVVSPKKCHCVTCHFKSQ